MKTNLFKKAAAVSLAAAMVFSQNVVSFAEDAGEKITVTFAFDEGVGTPTEEAIAAFNESQDEIFVQSYHLPQDANNLHDDFVNKMISEDTSIDVMALDVVYIAEFASAGWLEALDDLYTEEELGAYLDGTVEGAKYDGTLYAAPWFTNASALFYRTDVLEELGVTEVPTTFQGWKDLFDQLPEDSGIDYAFCFQGSQSEAMVCNWVEFLASFGASVLNEEGAPVCNSEEAVLATQMMADLVGTYAPEGTTTYAETEAQQVFQEGKALTCRTWSGTWNTFNNPEESDVAGNVGMTVLPVNEENDTSHSCLGGLDLAINTYISDEQKEATKTFVKWLTSEEEEKAFCLSSSQPPTVKAVYSDADVLEAIPFYTDFYSIIESGKGRPSTPDYSVLSDAIQRNVHMALTGESSVEDALNALQEEAEALQ
ncbi:MAG: ABC transporter substrate-binding protein [Blautia sp.]|nr:ABC transporter substrate-binding protein [Blautia sp.]